MLPVAYVPNRFAGFRSLSSARSVQELLKQAQQNGYEFGAHCLGGAYAIGPRLLARDDLLDWQPWVRTGLSEDIVVAVLASVAGLTVRGSVGPGETFGIAWQSLPLPPDHLIDRGYSVVHSVRDQPYGSESELRTFFRARRLESVSSSIGVPQPAER